MTTYSKDQLETCLCVWEAILEMRHAEKFDRNAMPADLKALFESKGTVEVRLEIVPEVAAWVDKVYPLLSEDVSDMFSFDWDIVPTLLAHVTWEPLSLPENHAEVADKVSKDLLHAAPTP